jgi:hypothetical protein
MQLAEEVKNYCRACERLLSIAAISRRPMTEDERRLVEFYCKEMLAKLINRS